MYWDWESIAIVSYLLTGLTVVILSFGVGAVHTRPPASPQEHRWQEVMALLTEVTRKAAMVDKTEKRLSMIREAAEAILNNLEESELKNRC
jgi:hypothetical protein